MAAQEEEEYSYAPEDLFEALGKKDLVGAFTEQGSSVRNALRESWDSLFLLGSDPGVLAAKTPEERVRAYFGVLGEFTSTYVKATNKANDATQSKKVSDLYDSDKFNALVEYANSFVDGVKRYVAAAKRGEAGPSQTSPSGTQEMTEPSWEQTEPTTQVQDLERRLQEWIEAAKKARNEFEQLPSQEAESQRRLADVPQGKELFKSIIQQLQDSENELGGCQESKDRLDKEKQDLEGRLTQAQEQLEALQQSEDARAAELQEAKDEAEAIRVQRVQRIEELEQQLDAAKRELEALQQRQQPAVTTGGPRTAFLGVPGDAPGAPDEPPAAAVQPSSERVRELEVRMEQLEKELSAAKNLAERWEKAYNNPETGVAALQRKNELLEGQLKTEEEDVRALEEQNQQLSQKNDALVQQLEQARAGREAAEQLEAQKQRFEQEKRELQAQLEAQRKQLEQCKQQFEVQQRTLEAQQQLLERLRGEITDLKSQLKEKADALEAAQAVLQGQEMGKQREAARTRIAELQTENATLKKTVDTIKKQNERLRKNLEAAKTEKVEADQFERYRQLVDQLVVKIRGIDVQEQITDQVVEQAQKVARDVLAQLLKYLGTLPAEGAKTGLAVSETHTRLLQALENVERSQEADKQAVEEADKVAIQGKDEVENALRMAKSPLAEQQRQQTPPPRRTPAQRQQTEETSEAGSSTKEAAPAPVGEFYNARWVYPRIAQRQDKNTSYQDLLEVIGHREARIKTNALANLTFGMEVDMAQILQQPQQANPGLGQISKATISVAPAGIASGYSGKLELSGGELDKRLRVGVAVFKPPAGETMPLKQAYTLDDGSVLLLLSPPAAGSGYEHLPYPEIATEDGEGDDKYTWTDPLERFRRRNQRCLPFMNPVVAKVRENATGKLERVDDDDEEARLATEKYLELTLELQYANGQTLSRSLVLVPQVPRLVYIGQRLGVVGQSGKEAFFLSTAYMLTACSIGASSESNEYRFKPGSLIFRLPAEDGEDYRSFDFSFPSGSDLVPANVQNQAYGLDPKEKSVKKSEYKRWQSQRGIKSGRIHYVSFNDGKSQIIKELADAPSSFGFASTQDRKVVFFSVLFNADSGLKAGILNLTNIEHKIHVEPIQTKFFGIPERNVSKHIVLFNSDIPTGIAWRSERLQGIEAGKIGGSNAYGIHLNAARDSDIAIDQPAKNAIKSVKYDKDESKLALAPDVVAPSSFWKDDRSATLMTPDNPASIVARIDAAPRRLSFAEQRRLRKQRQQQRLQQQQQQAKPARMAMEEREPEPSPPPAAPSSTASLLSRIGSMFGSAAPAPAQNHVTDL